MLILPWKMMFLFVIFLGTFIATSASSWMMAWMGLEINMLGLLALFMSFKSSRNSEATLKYFLIQALASAILICSALSGSMIFSFLSSADFFSSFIFLSLLVKLGAAPFHLWVPQIIEGLDWINLTLILTWQKVAPFCLIMLCFESLKTLNFNILLTSIILSAVLGALGGLSQSSTRKIIAFSSINHMGWMLFSLMKAMSLWLCYFSFYSAILMSLVMMMIKTNLNSLSQNPISMSKFSQTTLFTCLFSFGGLPPFSGFMPKWLVISQLSSFPFILTILVVSSLITLFFYLRLAMSSFLQKFSFSPLSLPKSESSFTTAMTLATNSAGLLIIPVLFLL